jgi:citronellol/citronellal dehydrogenase
MTTEVIKTGSLKGRRLFITGASRGIGLAIALRAAKDGASIAIAAKTTEPHPKLAGTIYTAAEAIEKAGGKALPLVVDVRDEGVVEAAVTQAAEAFGGLDILINNASAISLTGTLETPMKRYDLMHQINTRGTYLCSQKCLPHLLKSDNPHILNLSPPLNMEARWFGPHVAYTMAKFGMSMCVLGMADEFRKKGVAVNALWPRTAIDTDAMNVITGPELRKKCRKVEIMADAAHVVLTRPSRETTGNFFIDDEVLRGAGLTHFERYRYPGTAETDLIPDFFV